MPNPRCPDPRTDPIGYVKYTVACQVPHSELLWLGQTKNLCGYLPGRVGPCFVFTPEPTLPPNYFNRVLESPVVLLDSRMSDNPQLIHTAQINKLASDRFENPDLILDPKIPWTSVRLNATSRPRKGVSAFTPFIMAVNDMPDLSYIRWEHQLVVRDVVRDPDTIVLIAKAIRLQDHIYVHTSGDQVEKVEDASDAQLYCAFFAFADYLGGIKPRETYRWFDSILPSLGAAGANATAHLPKHGELSPEELFSLQIGKGVCMLCAQAKMMGIPHCDYHQEFGNTTR